VFLITKNEQCTCTTAAPNKAKKTPLMLMACTNNLVRVTVGRIKRYKHGAVVMCTLTISRSKEGAKRRTFILTETAPLKKMVNEYEQLLSTYLFKFGYIKKKQKINAIYCHTVMLT
jgi:hypothetical protein